MREHTQTAMVDFEKGVYRYLKDKFGYEYPKDTPTEEDAFIDDCFNDESVTPEDCARGIAAAMKLKPLGYVEKKNMTFKQFVYWCNERACDGCWGLNAVIELTKIHNEVTKSSFWGFKRERYWKEKYEQTVLKDYINPIEEKMVLVGLKQPK